MNCGFEAMWLIPPKSLVKSFARAAVILLSYRIRIVLGTERIYVRQWIAYFPDKMLHSYGESPRKKRCFNCYLYGQSLWVPGWGGDIRDTYLTEALAALHIHCINTENANPGSTWEQTETHAQRAKSAQTITEQSITQIVPTTFWLNIPGIFYFCYPIDFPSCTWYHFITNKC